MSSLRINKINNLIRKELDEIILKELSLKEGVFVTLTKVDTSPDMRYTKVFVSVFPEKERTYAEKTLRKETKYIQKFLHRKMTTKIFPQLNFEIDTSQTKVDEMEKIFKQL